MSNAITPLQAYLRHSASQQYRAIPVPPFTVFIQANDPLTFFNYGIPDSPISAHDHEASEALELLKDVFRRENRTPRFEFIGEYAPDLPTLLERAGFTEESRLPLMLCTPDTLTLPPAIAGLSIIPLAADNPADVAIAHSRIAYSAFGMTPAWNAEMEVGIPAQKATSAAQGMGMFVAYLDGQAVAVATYSAPYAGITEIAGIATLEGYRRRGIAGYITAVATAHAFAHGVTLALLSAGDAGAGRVYERVGFRVAATAVAYQL